MTDPETEMDPRQQADARLRPLYRLWALSALAAAGEIPPELARADGGLRAGKGRAQEGEAIDPGFAYFDSIC